MEIKDQIKLTYVSEIFIEDFDKGVYKFEDNQLVLVFVYDCNEVETGVSLIDNFILFVFKEIAHFGFTGNDELINLSYKWFTSLRKRCLSCCERL